MTTPTSQGERHAAGTARRWRWPWASSVIALVAVIGVVMAVYPTMAAWFNQVDQSRVIADAARNVQADPEAEVKALAEARKYNEELRTGARVLPNERIPSGVPSSPQAAGPSYDELLDEAGNGVMGRLRIPKIDVDLPIFHGTSDATLLRGLGHLEGTSLPVGGVGTHSVVTGHRGLANADMFTNLDRVGVGDTFTFEVSGEVLTYRIISTKVVEPDQTEALLAVPGQDLVTLVTCTPLGINSQRILVMGERVFPTPQDDLDREGQPSELPRAPWWPYAVGGAVLAGVVYVYFSGRPPRLRH